MKRFLSSDFHLGHFNIIKYCDRPFKTLEEMNEAIIQKHNSRVKDEDEVYFIGDFCFKNGKEGKLGEGEQTKAKEYLSRLKGRFIFIKGNHDRNNSLNVITQSLVIIHGGKRINLVHDPDFVDFNYELNFCGHVHGNWRMKRLIQGGKITDVINVGVDVHNFYPKTIEELLVDYYRWKKENNYK